ncbi:hypothetical protein AVEN_5529-1, partial [Araneus ventricosus]
MSIFLFVGLPISEEGKHGQLVSRGPSRNARKVVALAQYDGIVQKKGRTEIAAIIGAVLDTNSES